MKSKNKKLKSGKKQKDIGVKDYCEACLEIRNGSCNSNASSRRKLLYHTCGKTGQELKEFIYHMNILYVMRANGFSEGKYNGMCGDY